VKILSAKAESLSLSGSFGSVPEGRGASRVKYTQTVSSHSANKFNKKEEKKQARFIPSLKGTVFLAS
jgi:hypothetical protein